MNEKDDARTQVQAIVPLSALWLDAKALGVMLGASPRHVRERIAMRPDFPRPARLNGRTPRWNAAEVDAWIRTRQEVGRKGKRR